MSRSRMSRFLYSVFLALLSPGVTKATPQPAGGGDPLCAAVNQRDLGLVQALLDQGADPNARNPYSETALMIAVTVPVRGPFEGKSDPAAVVKLLLERGANPNLRDDSGKSALIHAMSGSATERAVLGASLAIAKLLLEHGAEVNA